MRSKTLDLESHEVAASPRDQYVAAQGLRECLLQLQHEAEIRGFALTAHLLAVAGDAILEEQMVHGAGRTH